MQKPLNVREATPGFLRFGFCVTDSPGEKNGLSYIPMKLELA